MNLSVKTQEVLAEARSQAILFRHAYIATEHILFAILKVAADEFENFNVKPTDVLRELVARIAPAPIDVVVDTFRLKYTPKTMEVLKAADGGDVVEVVDILLALLESEDTTAGDVLAAVGAEYIGDSDWELEDDEDALATSVEVIEDNYLDAIAGFTETLGDPEVEVSTDEDGVSLTLYWTVN